MELYDGESERVLMPGDVVMVNRKMKDNQGRAFMWKFFMIVAEETSLLDDDIEGYVVGNENLKGKTYRCGVCSPRNVIHYLAPEEWPDGIHAYRMQMILTSQITGVV